MRRMLDALYAGAGGLAALCILAICLIVSAQVGLNILARIGGPELSFTIPSYADFAGFLLAAATFLAMAHTLRSGVHIRVTLLTQRLPRGGQLVLEVAALTLGAAVAGYATWYAASLVAESHQYQDMSTGIIAVPIWIPQVPMVLGLALLTLAFVDTAIEALRLGRPVLIDAGAE